PTIRLPFFRGSLNDVVTYNPIHFTLIMTCLLSIICKEIDHLHHSRSCRCCTAHMQFGKDRMDAFQMGSPIKIKHAILTLLSTWKMENRDFAFAFPCLQT